MKFPLYLDAMLEVTTSSKLLKSKYDTEVRCNVEGQAFHLVKGGKDMYVIYLRNKSLNTIVHEAHHIVGFIEDRYEIKDIEFSAYLCAYIVDMISKVYNVNQ